MKAPRAGDAPSVYKRVLSLTLPVLPRQSAAICRNVAKTVQGALSWGDRLSGDLTLEYGSYSLRIVSSDREPLQPRPGLYLPCKITATFPHDLTFDMAISELGAYLGKKIEHILLHYDTDKLKITIEGRPLSNNMASLTVKLNRHDPGQ